MLGISNRGLFVGAVVVVLTGLVAGCGGSKNSPPTTTMGGGTQTTGQGSGFSTQSVGGLGAVVVDANGKPVYVLTKNGQNVPCTSASGCTAVWPPAGTYKGSPVYTYTGDIVAGQAKGEGLVSFGGTWYVLDASGTPVKQSGSGGGGGY